METTLEGIPINTHSAVLLFPHPSTPPPLPIPHPSLIWSEASPQCAIMSGKMSEEIAATSLLKLKLQSLKKKKGNLQITAILRGNMCL